MSKEAIKNLLMDFMADYDPNKWSNDDVYEKYAEKIDKVRSMGEIIAFTELTKKFKDLEAKLAESEKSKEINIKERDKICLEMATDYNKQILELKQQLAEKEKELQEVMGNVVGLVKSREIIALEKVQRFIDDEIEIPNDIGALMLADFFNKEIEKIKTSETYVSYKQSQTQTAIAELEKVLAKLSNIENTLINCGNGKEDAICWFVNIIDQQIKSLKGENV